MYCLCNRKIGNCVERPLSVCYITFYYSTMLRRTRYCRLPWGVCLSVRL